MILDGIGMRGDGGHTVNETADLRERFPRQISRIALLLHRLAAVGPLACCSLASRQRDLLIGVPT